MCWPKWMPWIRLFWVLGMLVVQSRYITMLFSPGISHSDYLPMIFSLGWIRSTCHISILGVYSFVIGSIFRSSRMTYIVNGTIISSAAHRRPLRCTDKCWPMIAQVNPSLQEVIFRPVLALYSLILGDIGDGEPCVSCSQIISFYRWSN